MSAHGAGEGMETPALAGGALFRLLRLLRAPHTEGVEIYCPSPRSPQVRAEVLGAADCAFHRGSGRDGTEI